LVKAKLTAVALLCDTLFGPRWQEGEVIQRERPMIRQLIMGLTLRTLRQDLHE